MTTLQDRVTNRDTRSRPIRDETVSEALARLDGLATIMDSAFRIPGTQVVMGLDALLGLVPVIGDAISSAIGGFIIWEAKRLGVSRFLIARMAMNTAIDTVLGSVPIVGDVFDVAYKANRKNVAILRRHLEKNGLRDGKTIEASYRAVPA
ncbi:MAG: DUF4112 domain-containing protein [Hyphomicrobium sp.]